MTSDAIAAQILRGVAALFETPDKWTQHAWCRDADGYPLPRAHDVSARCWCFVGAIRKVRGPGMSPAEDKALHAVRSVLWRQSCPGETISNWNDMPGRKVEDVRRVAIKAAELLEARP